METAASDAKVREANPEQGKRDFQGRSGLRSLVLLLVIVIVAVTVSDLRRPNADRTQAAFTDLVYERMDAQRADFWLGEASAKWLLEQGGWTKCVDEDYDTRRVAARLLDVPSATFHDVPVVGWDGIKMEEAARLWDLWQATAPDMTEEAFIDSQLALHVQNKTLPGLCEEVWIVNDVYLLVADGDLWGIRPLAELKHPD